MKFDNFYEKLFYEALKIRLAEERIADIYSTDKIQSPVHLSIGQEHISVGVCAHLKKEDLAFGTYRGHALFLAKGGTLEGLMAELYGKTTGCGGGKAGSMHLAEPKVGLMGSSAVVASTIPHAVGAALAAKIKKTDQVISCFYGDGATGEGVYHESLNIAAQMKLPVLFICENNGLAIFMKFKDLHSFDITEHAKAYGIPSETIENGCDLELIAQKAKENIDAIRKGSGPRLLEIYTYRHRQHVGPNEDYNLGYRQHSELEAWIKRDPLNQNKQLIEKFSKGIQAEIDRAIEFAENSPFPKEEDLYLDVH